MNLPLVLLNRRRRGGTAFSPASLFASGEEGAWYEPSPTTCFTDTAGTTAASVGDAVARINDLSGNGNHATQVTAAARPLLQQTAGGLYYLDFDGSDDGMATASIDFTGTDKMSVFAGARFEGSGAGQFLLESSENASTNNGTFHLIAQNNSPFQGRAFRSKGTSFGGADTALDAYPDIASQVLTGMGDISGDSAILRVNGVQVAQSSDDQGTGNFGNYPLNIGARDVTVTPEFFFDGKLFSLIVRGASSTAQEISQTESYLANRSGVTL